MSNICPECGEKSAVYDSRRSGEGIRKNRACISCGYKYVTMEVVIGETGKIKKGRAGGMKTFKNVTANETRKEIADQLINIAFKLKDIQ